MEWEHRIIRDPICGYVGLTELEMGLLDTPILQRLRGIKQLGFTDLVYPGATHTRFEHSLGCLDIADRIAQTLSFAEEERILVRIAALLHDIGHGPFSHVFENILTFTNDRKVTHEDVIVKLLAHPAITEKLGILGPQILSTLSPPRQETIISDILSGSLDVDKLDYLRRDSYYTGVAYGIFDFERIIHTMTSDDERHHLAVKEKGKDALESFRLARFLMHGQVYQHHVRAIADSMFIRAAEIALSEMDELRAQLNFDSENFVEDLLSFNDYTFKNHLLEKGPQKTKHLIERLDKRVLLKRGYEKDISILGAIQKTKIMKMTKEDFYVMETQIAESIHIDRELIVAYPIKIDNPVYIDPDRLLREETPLLIKMRNGQIMSFDEISPISGSTQKYLHKLFVFCPSEFIDSVSESAEEYVNSLT